MRELEKVWFMAAESIACSFVFLLSEELGTIKFILKPDNSGRRNHA